MLLSEMIEDFIYDQQVRGNAQATLDIYSIVLDNFKDFSGDISADDVNLELYKMYTLHLLNRNIKRTSVNTYLRHVRAFYNYCIECEYISDCSRRLKLCKNTQEVIIPLTDSELDSVLALFPADTFLNLRNRIIVLLMADCGLRRSEVINLQISDINFDRSYLKVCAKGRYRLVPFGAVMRELLYKYYARRSEMVLNHNFFLLSYYTCSPISEDVIKKLFIKIKNKTGIERIYPHLLRHTFATNYLLDGGDLEMLRLLLGHSSVSVTQIYLHLAANNGIIDNARPSHFDKIFTDFQITS